MKLGHNMNNRSKVKPIEPAPGGIQDGMKGSEYQEKLIELYSMVTFNKSRDFECWTEDTRAGKFDDLVISYSKDSNTSYTFLQAKYKARPEELKFLDFFSNNKYQLHKYFESFVEIENNFKIDYQTNDIDDVIIATNNPLPKPVNDLLALTDPSLKVSELKLEFVKNHELANIATVYTLPETDNFESLKQIFLAIELVQLMFNKPSKFHVLRHSREFLLENIFEEDGNSVKFKSQFLNPGFLQTENFREIFMQVIEHKFVDIVPKLNYSNQEQFWGHFRKMKFDKNKKKFSDEIHNLDSDENFSDQKLKRFLKKLLIVTSLDLTEIENSIKFNILNQINDVNELENVNLKFQKFFQDWLLRKDANSGWSPIDNVRISEILNQFGKKAN